MYLTVDIGNTTIALGLVKNRKVIADQRLETVSKADQLMLQLTGVLRSLNRKGKIEKAIICSVVPHATALVKRTIFRELKVAVAVVGEDIKVPLMNRYKNPRQVGQDRLVGAFAAMRLYGQPAIIIDLGTAITFDAVSGKGEYLGGAIVPGIRLSAESLFLKTALLPEIAIRAPKSVIGQTTEESILSGLFYGYGSLCRGFIDLMKKQMRGQPKVVMTGGHTQLMKRFIQRDIRIIDENLVFKGLALLLGESQFAR
jgi:type III pantothenate kinase